MGAHITDVGMNTQQLRMLHALPLIRIIVLGGVLCDCYDFLTDCKHGRTSCWITASEQDLRRACTYRSQDDAGVGCWHLPSTITDMTVELLFSVTDTGMMILVNALPKGLRTFELRMVSPQVANFEGLWNLPGGLTKFRLSGSLFRLTWPQPGVSDEDLKNLAEHLPAGLTELTLNCRLPHLSDEGVKSLAEHLPAGLTKLDLDVDYPNVTDEGLKSLAGHLPAGLTELRLAFAFSTGLSDEGLESLAEHLPAGLTKLHLTMFKTAVSDEGVESLAGHLPAGLVKLFLDVSYSAVSDEGFMSLAKHTPAGLCSLELTVENGNVTEAGMEEAKDCLPSSLVKYVSVAGGTLYAHCVPPSVIRDTRTPEQSLKFIMLLLCVLAVAVPIGLKLWTSARTHSTGERARYTGEVGTIE